MGDHPYSSTALFEEAGDGGDRRLNALSLVYEAPEEDSADDGESPNS